MNPMHFAASTAILLAVTPALDAQIAPRLRATAAASVAVSSSVLTFDTIGTPGAPYAVFTDDGSGPATIGSLELRLALSPILTPIVADVIDPTGFRRRSVSVPNDPALADLVLYHQAVVLSSSGGQGVLQASNGESSALHGTVSALVERFDDPRGEGYTGDFDPSSIDTIRGVFRRRTVRPVDGTQQLDPNSFPVPFGQGILSPLDPRGNRTQWVVRNQEIGGSGADEVITDIRWRAFPALPLVSDQFANVEVRLAHSQVVPNYSVGGFTALPEFPNSGLATRFASNVSGSETLVRTGPYTVDPSAATPGRFVSYDIGSGFTYNGLDSLLIDVRTFPDPNALGLNGQLIYLPIQSSPNPFSRIVAAVPFLSMGTLDPNAVTSGNGDNSIYDIEIDMARISATATSPFRASGLASPDYGTPLVATVTPGQSSVALQYRGADDALGSGVTAWSTSVDIADGKPFLQISIDLLADLRTGGVPEIDTLVVPVR